MSASTIEIDFWQNGVPVLIFYSIKEFDTWLNGVPFIDQGNSPTRRRVVIF